MEMKEQYQNIILKVDDLVKRYVTSFDENILPIIKYELYKIVKFHIKEIGLEKNEYAYSTGLIIVNSVVDNYFWNYDKTKDISLGEKLISTLKKMSLRKKVYQLGDLKEEDLLIQRYSYIVDKKLNQIDTIDEITLRKLIFEKYEEIVKRLQKNNNMKRITKIADSQLFQYGLSKRREINRIYKQYLEIGKPMLIKFLALFDEEEKKNVEKYYTEVVKNYFSDGLFYINYDFEKYLFEELSNLNLSKIDSLIEMYNESKKLKYKPKTRI